MFGLLSLALLAPAADPTPALELKDGDRVVWVGSTFVEREQRYGYWETALHAAFPKADFTVRNLGWSGDTVFGDARAGFDTPAKGFERLVSLTLELKPTVILVGYGTNESFEGEAGLKRFEAGLNKLLDALKRAGARVVLVSPPAFFGGRGGADAQARRESLRQYAEVVRTTAAARGVPFADLQGKTLGIALAVSDNGIHPTETGYQALSWSFLAELGQRRDPLHWPSLEPLRKAVVAKNELFFHRWRPQNETYLFGFRKHEQGKNAKEVAAFDPLVAEAEKEIARVKRGLLK